MNTNRNTRTISDIFPISFIPGFLYEMIEQNNLCACKTGLFEKKILNNVLDVGKCHGRGDGHLQFTYAQHILIYHQNENQAKYIQLRKYTIEDENQNSQVSYLLFNK